MVKALHTKIYITKAHLFHVVILERLQPSWINVRVQHDVHVEWLRDGLDGVVDGENCAVYLK